MTASVISDWFPGGSRAEPLRAGRQHLLLGIKEDFHKEIGLKSGFKHKLFLADAMELRLHLRNQIKSGLAKNVHVKGRMIFPGSGSVFTKYNIETPVQLVFN